MTDGGSRRAQPVWAPPARTDATKGAGLMLTNSFTRQKELFVPKDGNKVSWYICGPTVYDSSHMGHARSYMSFDILRRVLQSYFGYDVQYVMNVTDVDDKIIKRARQRHLMDLYAGEQLRLPQILEDVKSSLALYQDKIKNEEDMDKKDLFRKNVERVDNLLKSLPEPPPDSTANQETLMADPVVRDVLSDWLDKHQGSTITDHQVFAKLARRFEAEYHADMKALGVLPPDVLTRVSEFVPEIVVFIQKIIDNGFAYESNGSVYFSTNKFNNDEKHFYAKLVPEAFLDTAALDSAMREGEGELSMGAERLKEKQEVNDFALWKASKPGEPAWDSQWGKGRPGWHIECSVMATEVCGESLDIHSGGFDLKFPHHDNEIAQTEACYGCGQWINYFLHAGTLRIAGLKMSKSLKNFISIRAALEKYSARQLRILFLLHNWEDVLDFSEMTMDHAFSYEKMLSEYFLIVKHYLRSNFNPSHTDAYVKWRPVELELSTSFSSYREKIHSAMCNSVDTPAVLGHIRELISDMNRYIRACETAKETPNCLLLRRTAIYITDMLRVFGVVGGSEVVGWSEDGGVEGAGGQSTEDIAMPYLNALAEFRERVRELARTEKSTAILTECDQLRDDVLPDLGVRLEDREKTVIKLVDRATLMAEREQKIQMQQRLAAEKALKRQEREAKEAKKAIPPSELFKAETGKYSKFDEKGIPTHDSAGEEISKKNRKKLEKLYETQDAKYKTFLAGKASAGGDGSVVNGNSS